VTLAPKLNTWPIAIFVIGLFGTYALVTRRVPGALLFGILGTTLLATIVNEIKDTKVFPNGSATWPSKIVAPPDFGLVGNFSLHFISALGFWSAVAIVISVLLSDFFDTAGTVLGLGRRAALVTQDGRLPGSMRRVLIVDSLAAAGGGAASASSNTTFIESSAGIGEGGRTGLASIVTGASFLCCLFISPLAGIIPSAATAPVLVIVGAMMFELVRHLE
jgi:AGZA family xanthine/uracil permease-like MFS transporter